MANTGVRGETRNIEQLIKSLEKRVTALEKKRTKLSASPLAKDASTETIVIKINEIIRELK